MHTILHGKHFLIVDERGDITNGVEGLYARDARMLSRWRLLVDSRRPQPLGEPHGPHFQRAFVQRNIRGTELHADALIVERRFAINDALYERIVCENVTSDSLEFEIAIETAADFMDLFAVKREEFARLGDDPGEVGAVNAPRAREHPAVASGSTARCAWGEDVTTIDATEPFRLGDDGVLRWQIALEPRARWSCEVRVSWDAVEAMEPIDFDRRRTEVEREIAMWLAETPKLLMGPEHIRRAYRTSVDDLAALRIAAGRNGSLLPAAGMPWFMTAFGRDTLITCMQTMALGPRRAMGAIEYLAELQATEDLPEADAEPGKILHEVREGAIATRGYGVYYGSLDSTPLFLILLDEIHRWTRDDEFAHRLRPNAMAALEWLERWGDPDDDGFLEYAKRSPQGLDNQSWKDSWDSQRFHTGALAAGPIAPAEVQGYAYDARVRLARIARTAWDDHTLANRLEQDAAALRERFNRDFWVAPDRLRLVGADDPRRDGYFALALDGDKQPVDSLTSNIGHLLWSGIVDESKVDAVVRQLTSRQLYNGWGIRTMSTMDAAFNPISYHNGTVWPHDTSLCVAGLVRHGAYDVAARIANAMFDAAREFEGRLPEVFAGLDRTDTGHPVEYPTASRPQAWAAATTIYLLTELVGLAPHPDRPELTLRHAAVSPWLEQLEWRGIRAFGASWDVAVRHGVPVLERH